MTRITVGIAALAVLSTGAACAASKGAVHNNVLATPSPMSQTTTTLPPTDVSTSPVGARFADSGVAPYGTLADLGATPIRVPSRRPDGKLAICYSVTPDGVSLVCQLEAATPPSSTDSSIPARQGVVLLSTKTAQTQLLAGASNPQRQVVSADANDRWVVWSEGQDQNTVLSDWSIEVFDRTTKVHRRIAAYTRDGSRIPSTPPVIVHLHGNDVLWSAVQPVGGDHLVVYDAALVTGRVRATAIGAADPAPSDTALLASIPAPGGIGKIVARIANGRTQPWPSASSERQIHYLAAGPSGVVEIGPDGDEVHVLSADGQHDTVVEHRVEINPSGNRASTAIGGHSGGTPLGLLYAQFPTVGDRWIVWSREDASIAYDTVTGRRIVLGVRPNAADGFANGSAVVWTADGATPGSFDYLVAASA